VSDMEIDMTAALIEHKHTLGSGNAGLTGTMVRSTSYEPLKQVLAEIRGLACIDGTGSVYAEAFGK
jgi:hypothetical protein